MFSRFTNSVAPVVTIHANFGASEASFHRGQEIHGQGEPADRIYEVQRGAVRCCRLLADGRRQICAFHLENDLFGWENGPNYRFTAEAIVDTVVHVIKRQTLACVAATNVQVTSDLLSMATKSLEHAENQMMLLGRRNSRERVAAFILEMDRRLSSSGIINLPMSRRDIADYLGLTEETVSREFSWLRDVGILLFPDHHSQRLIMLNDRCALQKLTREDQPQLN